MQQFIVTTVGFDNSELEEYWLPSLSPFLSAESFSLVPRVLRHAGRMQGMSGYPGRAHEAGYATVDSTTPNLGGTSRAKFYSLNSVRRCWTEISECQACCAGASPPYFSGLLDWVWTPKKCLRLMRDGQQPCLMREVKFRATKSSE